LGPILFNIYMSDIEAIVRPFRIISYADDSYVVVSANSLDDLIQSTQITLNEHFSWLQEIGMTCNHLKTELIIFNEDDIEINVGGSSVRSGKTMKVLGVLIDNDLNWSPYVEKILSKSRSLLFAFRYLRRHLEIKDMKFIVNAHLISRLSYACAAWSHSLSYRHKIRIRSAYFSTLRIIVRDFDRKMSRRQLLETFELEEIDTIFFKRTSVFIFKVITQLNPTNLAGKFLSKSYMNARNPERLKLFDTSKRRIGKLCLTNAAKRFVDCWDFDWLLLTLQMFKNKLHLCPNISN